MQRILVDVFRNRYVVCLFLSIFKLSLFLLQLMFSFRGSYRQCYDRYIYALGTVTFIRSITGVTNKKRSATAIMHLHKFISHSFDSISINSKK